MHLISLRHITSFLLIAFSLSVLPCYFFFYYFSFQFISRPRLFYYFLPSPPSLHSHIFFLCRRFTQERHLAHFSTFPPLTFAICNFSSSHILRSAVPISHHSNYFLLFHLFSRTLPLSLSLLTRQIMQLNIMRVTFPAMPSSSLLVSLKLRK